MASSPINNRLKFFCSHGGMILPCPPHAHLKYVGGHTRLISLPTHISFQELMKKLTSTIDGEMTLKFQVVPEDLDTLVTVRSDKDLRHMMEEMEHCEIIGAPRVHAFLFPSIVERSSRSSNLISTTEQRYIDAINGAIWSQHNNLAIHIPMPPRSPDNHRNADNKRVFPNNHGRVNVIHKVESSPSLSSINTTNSHYSHHQLIHYVHGNTSPKQLYLVRPVGLGDGTLRVRMDPEGALCRVNDEHDYAFPRGGEGRQKPCHENMVVRTNLHTQCVHI